MHLCRQTGNHLRVLEKTLCRHQDGIKAKIFYMKWLNINEMIRSYQSKLFTAVRTEVLVKGESLSANSPKHGPEVINTGIKSRRGLRAFSGVAGIYHFINSVNVFLSSRNENFLEGRCVNESVCSNSPSIFTISPCAVRGLLFFRSFFLKTLKVNVRNLDSVLPFGFTNKKKVPCNKNKKNKVAAFKPISSECSHEQPMSDCSKPFLPDARVAHLSFYAHLRRLVYLLP